MGMGEKAYDVKIQPLLDDFFGHIFEDVCMQFLKRLIAEGKIDTVYTEYGAWWGANPAKKREEEINIVLTNDEEILVGECKWRNEKIGNDVISLLQERGSLIRNGRNIKYALFSKAGFTEDCTGTASVNLFSLRDLL